MILPLASADLLPKVIMGVDPGTQVMGYAVIEVQGQRVRVLRYDVIEMKKLANHALKLKRIFDRMVELIDEFLPDELAIEAPFYGVNVQSMLKLGRAQGVAIAACLSRQIPYVEYAPTKVKQSVTGQGTASKEQVAHMLRQTLQLAAPGRSPQVPRRHRRAGRGHVPPLPEGQQHEGRR